MVMNNRSSRNQVEPMLATLADLLAPVSLSEFLEGFRARRRLHISTSDPTRAETLLSWQDIDTLLSAHGLGENVSMWRDGVLLPRPFYTSNGGTRIKVRAFHDLLSQGVSIVVEKIDRSIPQISQLTAAIEREMGTQTQANAYLSFSKGERSSHIGTLMTSWPCRFTAGNDGASGKRLFHIPSKCATSCPSKRVQCRTKRSS
jgi:hypothetical protein